MPSLSLLFEARIVFLTIAAALASKLAIGSFSFEAL